MKVLSIEQMNKLKDLGVDVTPKDECLIYQNVMGIDILAFTDKFQNEEVKAFTLQDVIELLPKVICIDSIEYSLIILQAVDGFYVQYSVSKYLNDDLIWEYNENVLIASYKMLLWVIENGYLKVNTDENN